MKLKEKLAKEWLLRQIPFETPIPASTLSSPMIIAYLAGFEKARDIALTSLDRVHNDDIASEIVYKALEEEIDV